MASLNAVLYNTVDFGNWVDSLDGVTNADATVNDFAGWAGDVVSGADNIQKAYATTGQNRMEAAAYYIGNKNGDGSCQYDDVLADIDGYNIGVTLLNTGATLPSVFRTYYATGGTCNNRFNHFFNDFTRLETNGYSGTPEQNLYNRVMDCCTSTLDPLILNCRDAITAGIAEKNGGYQADLDSLHAAGEAFYNLVLSGVNQELNR